MGSMVLGELLALLFFVVAAFDTGGLWFFVHSVLPQVVSGTVYLFVASKSIALVAMTLLLTGVLFLAFGQFIVRPIRRLTEAIIAFAARGEQLPIPIPLTTPREIRELIGAFGQLTAQVQAANERNKEAARVKGDFITTAAHQLRTPLTAVRWSLEALSSSPLSDDQRMLVNSALEKGKDLVAIVGTLLDISSIESGKYKYQFVPTDMLAILNAIAYDFEPLTKKKGVALTVKAPAQPVPKARADADRIKWVLNNLIENAIRYTPEGGVVELSLDSGFGKVFARVRDTGIGIPMKDRNNIFERFFRAGNAIAKENEGNGLGLYIARQVARDHGGELSFAPNDSGHGTTFTLALPSA